MTTVNLQVGSGNDDGRQSGTSVSLTDANLNLNSAGQILALRFNNVTVPQAAVITAADFILEVANSTNDHYYATIYGEDADDSAALSTSSNDFSNRTTTTASVSVGVETGSGPYTVSLTSIVQEIVDRGGWASGNDMTILMYFATSADLRVKAYDGSAVQAAQLDITYTDAPVLSSPTNDSRTNDGAITFEWGSVASATKYDIEIATDSGFTSIVEDDDTVVATSYTSSTLDDDLYYWRVRAFVGSWGSWSSTYTVRVQQVAFPGAEGGGALTAYWLRQQDEGTPTIYVINTLADASTATAGMLRYALEQTGPRIIMFEVAGIIDLVSPLVINDPYFYIAGQTAFRLGGGGILLRHAPIRSRTHDAVIRYMRVYSGDTGGEWAASNTSDASCLEINHVPANDGDDDAKAHHIIVDHCEFCWDFDTTVEIYNGQTSIIDPHTNTTLQWCLIFEPLDQNAAAPSERARAMLIGDKITNWTVHHCGFFHAHDRGPHYKSDSAYDDGKGEWINNLWYNVQEAFRIGASADTGETSTNIIGNTELQGASTPTQEVVFGYDFVAQTHHLYLSDNQAERTDGFVESGYNAISALTFEDHVAVTTDARADAINTVLNATSGAGCVLDLTAQAQRMRDDWDSGGTDGDWIDDQDDPPNSGWPSISSMSGSITSAQSNSIPDDWATSKGLTPASFDEFGFDLDPRYTNIEVYINGLVPGGAGSSSSEADRATERGILRGVLRGVSV